MTTITNFNRTNVDQMRREVEAALKQVGDKYGLIIGIGRITFGANEFRTKLTVVTKSSAPNVNVADPQAARRATEAAALANNLWQIGLQRADLVNKFRDAAVGECQFIGFAPRRHKYPYTIRTTRGKTLKISVGLAKQIALNKVA
jgi:hypothetical protein